eukprot:gene3001-1983_t
MSHIKILICTKPSKPLLTSRNVQYIVRTRVKPTTYATKSKTHNAQLQQQNPHNARHKYCLPRMRNYCSTSIAKSTPNQNLGILPTNVKPASLLTTSVQVQYPIHTHPSLKVTSKSYHIQTQPNLCNHFNYQSPNVHLPPTLKAKSRITVNWRVYIHNIKLTIPYNKPTIKINYTPNKATNIKSLILCHKHKCNNPQSDPRTFIKTLKIYQIHQKNQTTYKNLHHNYQPSHTHHHQPTHTHQITSCNIVLIQSTEKTETTQLTCKSHIKQRYNIHNIQVQSSSYPKHPTEGIDIHRNIKLKALPPNMNIKFYIFYQLHFRTPPAITQINNMHQDNCLNPPCRKHNSIVVYSTHFNAVSNPSILINTLTIKIRRRHTKYYNIGISASITQKQLFAKEISSNPSFDK